jgi:hypothetical protein
MNAPTTRALARCEWAAEKNHSPAMRETWVMQSPERGLRGHEMLAGISVAAEKSLSQGLLNEAVTAG